uniref:Uncharacterized protein n=1 Tax=Arundo donax TaxID=35708 RepID=A0A0A9C317_ARUDO
MCLTKQIDIRKYVNATGNGQRTHFCKSKTKTTSCTTTW